MRETHMPVFRLLRGQFFPAGATRCTDGAEIWRGGVDSSTPNITPSMHSRSVSLGRFLMKFSGFWQLHDGSSSNIWLDSFTQSPQV